MHGALLVDKPSGPTSHDIVAVARRALKTPRVGHTGTLDPLATGLLVLLIGQATRLSQFLVTDEKEYVADIRLGLATATYDSQGLDGSSRLKAEATGSREDTTGEGANAADPSRGFRLQAEDLNRVLAEFRGTILQTPPPYSAKKIDGVRAYKKARKNEPVGLKPVEVTVRELELLSDDPRPSTLDPRTLVRLRIVCTAGFYVRSLAHDVGQRLGCGAHLEALRRTRAGPFLVGDALPLDAIEAAGAAIEGRLVGLNTLLADMPAVTLTSEGSRRASHGNTLAPEHLQTAAPGLTGHPRIRVLDGSGALLAIAEASAGGLLHPLVVLR
jgi:tRNA pseudouridine55 synthase